MIIDDLWQNSRLVKSVDWLDHSLAMVPLILTRDDPTKKMAQIIKKLGFKIQNWHEDQHQSISRTIGILTKVFCASGLNLVILALDQLWCGQAQNGVNLELEV